MHKEVVIRHAASNQVQRNAPHCKPPAAPKRPPDRRQTAPAPACAYPALRLAITDEASPFALRSTRNRLRTAVRRGAAWTAECHRGAAWLRPWPESRWQCFTAKQLWLPIAARGPASPNPRTAVRDRAASSRWSGMPGRLLRRPAPARAHCLASALRSSRPRSNRPGGRRPWSSRPVSSRPVSSRPVSNRPVSNRPVSNRPGVRPSGVRRVRPLREPLGGRLSQTWSR